MDAESDVRGAIKRARHVQRENQEAAVPTEPHLIHLAHPSCGQPRPLPRDAMHPCRACVHPHTNTLKHIFTQNLRRALHQRQRDRAVQPPAPAYTDAPPEYDEDEHVCMCVCVCIHTCIHTYMHTLTLRARAGIGSVGDSVGEGLAAVCLLSRFTSSKICYFIQSICLSI